MPLDIIKYSPMGKNSARGRTGGIGHPNINLAPLKIMETTAARILKLKIQLNIMKYSLWVQKISLLEGVQGA